MKPSKEFSEKVRARVIEITGEDPKFIEIGNITLGSDFDEVFGLDNLLDPNLKFNQAKFEEIWNKHEAKLIEQLAQCIACRDEWEDLGPVDSGVKPRDVRDFLKEDFGNVCLSGGCKGADLEWGAAAKAAGHDIIHYGFQGMNQSKSKVQFYVLNIVQLLEADSHLKKANETLKRGSFPYKSEYTNNLLRRSYWQVKDTECVYAVAPIEIEKKAIGTVRGGTGWAVQMAINLLKPVYVFDLVDKCWKQWMYEDGWVDLIIHHPPKPHGIYTGIGSREITDDGREAISNVFQFN